MRCDFQVCLSNVLEIKEPCLDTITHVKAVQQHSDPFAAGNITKCVLDLGLEQIHGPSSSSQTQEMTSLRNQNNSSIHPQANAPTVDMAAGTNAVGPQHLNNEPDVTTSCCSRTGMRGCTQLTPSHDVMLPMCRFPIQAETTQDIKVPAPATTDLTRLKIKAPRSLEYVPDPIKLEDHVPTHIPKHPKDLVPAEDEAPIEAYIPEVASAPTPPLPPSFLSPRTPPLLPIPLLVPSTSCRAEIPEADTPPRKRLLLTAPRPGCEEDDDRLRDGQHEGQLPGIEERERLAYEQESIQTREALARSEAYSRALEARVAVLETQACRNEWQRQTADDFAVQHIMHTQALEAG
nr:hypothetical protein [Tanacetum cinerariifolium]